MDFLSDPRARAFRSGVLRTLPFLSGMVPFGVLYATLAVAAGWSWALTLFMSVAVFGGSSQLVFIDLLGRAAPPLQAALGANIVNARHLIYSAGLSETFAPFPRRWKIVLSYLMTDQLFAVSRADRKQMEALPPAVRPWFFFGSGLFTWAGWLASTALGLVFGEAIPASWNLSFAIPLMFMPMVFVTGHWRTTGLTCGLAVLFVVLFRDFPFGLGVFCAILLASAVGAVVLRRGRA